MGVHVSRSEVILWQTSSQRFFKSSLTEPNALLWPRSCTSNLGRPGGVGYNGNIYGVADEHGDGIVASLSYPDPENWNSSADGTRQTVDMESLGFAIEGGSGYLNRSFQEWPTYVDGSDFEEWVTAVKALQGKDGISFVGEVLAGNNVPAIIDHTTAFFISGDWLENFA